MKATKLSNKGRVILPSAVRSANQWKARVAFAATTLDEVIGCTGYVGKSYSVAEMHEVFATEANPAMKLL